MKSAVLFLIPIGIDRYLQHFNGTSYYSLFLSPYNYRLEEFLKKEVDLELSTLPDFEERVIDVSEVEQLMNSINAIPGTLPN